MELNSSLPQPQIPATCPYPKPARSSPQPYISLPDDPSEYYPPSNSTTVNELITYASKLHGKESKTSSPI